MKTKEIHIEWSGPYTYDEIIHNVLKDGFAVKPDAFGLYQIYGAHPLYGNNVLLYIGKTEIKFSERLNGRGVIVDNFDSGNIQIYLGRTYYDDTLKHVDTSDDISRAESLLIHYHKPGHNSSNINSLKYANEDIVVINVGSYRSLHQEISTQAFTKELKIYAKIYEIAEELGISNIDNDEDGYGFYLNEEESLWFGVLYDLWCGDTILVLSSNNKLDKSFIFYDEDEDEDGKYYYKAINGNIDEIKIKIKEIIEIEDK